MASLPYESATSGERAIGEIQKVLRAFGCTKFGSMIDDEAGVVLVQFERNGTRAEVRASMKGYAAAYLKAHPYGPRMRTSRVEYERKALDVASVAVYSILRDWIKGQVTAIETGILSFEGAFLGQILLGNGQTVLEHAQQQKLLTAPSISGNIQSS